MDKCSGARHARRRSVTGWRTLPHTGVTSVGLWGSGKRVRTRYGYEELLVTGAGEVYVGVAMRESIR